MHLPSLVMAAADSKSPSLVLMLFPSDFFLLRMVCGRNMGLMLILKAEASTPPPPPVTMAPFSTGTGHCFHGVPGRSG